MFFISTPFDIKSAKMLKDIVDVIKISSGDNNFLQLINTCLKFNKPIIISTGLLKDKEIKKLYNYVKNKISFKKLCFLHCVSSYPTDPKNANLKYIAKMKKEFKNITIGYSDHTIGPNAAILSSCLGQWL